MASVVLAGSGGRGWSVAGRFGCGRRVVGVGSGAPVAAAGFGVDGGFVVVIVVVVAGVRMRMRGLLMLVMADPHWWTRDLELWLVRVQRDGRRIQIEISRIKVDEVRIVQVLELLVAGVEELAGGLVPLGVVTALVAVEVWVVIVVVGGVFGAPQPRVAVVGVGIWRGILVGSHGVRNVLITTALVAVKAMLRVVMRARVRVRMRRVFPLVTSWFGVSVGYFGTILI